MTHNAFKKGEEDATFIGRANNPYEINTVEHINYVDGFAFGVRMNQHAADLWQEISKEKYTEEDFIKDCK